MYRIDLSKGGRQDLDELMESDPSTASRILATLHEIDKKYNSPDVFLTLKQPQYTQEGYVVKFIWEPYHVDGILLWSLKVFADPLPASSGTSRDARRSVHHRVPIAYRVLMGVNNKERRFIILAVAHRLDCYETEGKNYERVKSEYGSCGCGTS